MSTKCDENGCTLDFGDDKDDYKGADASNDREEAEEARKKVKIMDIPSSDGFVNLNTPQ